MLSRSLLLLAFALPFVFSLGGGFGKLVATAFLREAEPIQNLIIGEINFYQKDSESPVTVVAFAAANDDWFVANDFYGIHVHEYGDITARDASLIGGHYVGLGIDQHHCPPELFRHGGDLGNFRVNNLHQINQWKQVDLLQCFNDTGSIIGRSIAITALEDPCMPVSSFGPIAAFGVIGIARKAKNVNVVPPVGSNILPSALAAYLTGSKLCFECYGFAYLWTGSGGELNFLARAVVPNSVAKANGFVLHQSGDITTKTGALMGSHFQNTNDSSHAIPPFDGHAGDLGNNQFYTTLGEDFIQIWTQKIVTTFSIEEAIGRSLAVYENYDHGSNCKNGALGGKLLFGVFGLPNPQNVFPSVPADRIVVPPLDYSDCNNLSAGNALVVSLSVLLSAMGYLLLQ